jgi:hypothetical protein
MSQVGSGLSVVGALMGDRTISQAGTVASIAGANNPAMAAAMTAGNIATKGMLGIATGIIGAKSLANVADIAMAVANPALGITNGILGLADMPSLGTMGANLGAAMDPNSSVNYGDIFSNITQSVISQEADMRANPSTDPTNSDVMGNIANEANPSDTMQGLMDSTNAFGTADTTSTDSTDSGGGYGGVSSDGASGGSRTGDSSHGSAGAPGGGDSSGNSGSGGDGGGDADGGPISGPGTGISDSITRQVSDGEFVLSADVVDAIGIEKLKALQNKYHTPAAVQKLQQFARA